MAAHMIGVWGVVNRQVNAIQREHIFRDRLNPLDIFDDIELPWSDTDLIKWHIMQINIQKSAQITPKLRLGG